MVKHIFISGKVQGVSFRYHTFERAQKLGVTGWIRNLDDGRVEAVLVSTDEKAIEELVAFLKTGPPRAQIEKFELNDVKDKKVDFKDFSIRRDGGATWQKPAS